MAKAMVMPGAQMKQAAIFNSVVEEPGVGSKEEGKERKGKERDHQAKSQRLATEGRREQ